MLFTANKKTCEAAIEAASKIKDPNERERAQLIISNVKHTRSAYMPIYEKQRDRNEKSWVR